MIDINIKGTIRVVQSFIRGCITKKAQGNIVINAIQPGSVRTGIGGYHPDFTPNNQGLAAVKAAMRNKEKSWS